MMLATFEAPGSIGKVEVVENATGLPEIIHEYGFIFNFILDIFLPIIWWYLHRHPSRPKKINMFLMHFFRKRCRRVALYFFNKKTPMYLSNFV